MKGIRTRHWGQDEQISTQVTQDFRREETAMFVCGYDIRYSSLTAAFLHNKY
jgi:hypothetical protein